MTAPVACLKGEYQDTTGQQTCKVCTLGKYCDRQGLAAVSGDCPAGYYCPAGTSNPMSNLCPAGTFCAAGSSAVTPCPSGKYCQESGLAAVSGDCEAGYFCSGTGETVKNPSSKMCSKGNYCPAGSTAETPCPTLKYNDKLGASVLADCMVCPPGKQCTPTGVINPASTCAAGKYCPAGAAPVDCEVGYYCPANLDYKIRCQPGSYQDATAQSTCKECPIGFYCYFNGTGLTEKIACPTGYYCPKNTQHYFLYPCAAGTFRATVGATKSSDCTTCTIKKYCLVRGLSAESGSCMDGFNCAAGSVMPTGINEDACPKNNYCAAGTQTACANGKFNPVTGSAIIGDCVNCPPGKFCASNDGIETDCPAGKVCVQGLSSATTDCAAGHYCPSNTPISLKCPPG